MTGARIIYVTGMKPKPPPDLHRAALLRVLEPSLARVRPAAADWLLERPENFVLVSWTKLLYAEQRDIALDLPGIERLLEDPTVSEQDRREANRLRRWLQRAWHLVGDSFPVLSRVMASQSLQVTLADVRRYLSNTDGIGDRIRRDLHDAISAAGDERVLLIGHSLGSVIAYDCLWEMSHEMRSDKRIGLFLTLGSPLATRFIRKGLKGAGERGARQFPTNIDHWLNVAARGEMVALHTRLKPFFVGMLRQKLIESLEDKPGIYNPYRDPGGINPHKSYGYLTHRVVAGAICNWLG